MSGVRPSCISFTDLAAGLAQLSTLHDFADEMLVASDFGSPGFKACPPNAREVFEAFFDFGDDAKLYTNCPATATSSCYIACSESISLAQSGVYAPTTSCTSASFDVYIPGTSTLLANATANSLALPPFWFDELPPTRYLQAVRYLANDCSLGTAVRIEMFPVWDKCTQLAGKNVFIQSQVGNGSLTHRACTDAACSVGCVSQNVVSAAGSATSACVAAKDNVMTSVGVNTFIKLSGIFDAVKLIPSDPTQPKQPLGPKSNDFNNDAAFSSLRTFFLIAGTIFGVTLFAVIIGFATGCIVFSKLICCGGGGSKTTPGYVVREAAPNTSPYQNIGLGTFQAPSPPAAPAAPAASRQH
ncbi:hypothetical protein HK105_205112 [Polyrhizophydium stewartii]|uniref:Uncharacterized protein n=1 Tax=Polyrhizophydium stewartii TaxID=2732419 RepID=A0ABR4N6T0_9FUNG